MKSYEVPLFLLHYNKFSKLFFTDLSSAYEKWSEW